MVNLTRVPNKRKIVSLLKTYSIVGKTEVSPGKVNQFEKPYLIAWYNLFIL
jgi:hypothetical protein